MEPSRFIEEWSILSPAQLQRVHSIHDQLRDIRRRAFIVDPPSSQKVNAEHGLERSMADKCDLVDSPVIVGDQNGIIILVYIPGFISSRCTRRTASAIETLLCLPGLPAPLSDARHAHLDTVKIGCSVRSRKIWIATLRSLDGTGPC